MPELVDDPRFARNQDRTANREELRPLLVERLQTRTKHEWFRDIIAAGVPCGPINTIDGGVAFAEEIGLDPVVAVGPTGAAVPSRPQPDHASRRRPAEYRLPPPGLDEHGAEIRAWLDAPQERAHDRGSGDRRSDDRPAQFPTSLGTSDADHIRLLGQDLAADLMGKVGFGELAFWLVALRRPTPARSGSSRPCWSRWPTTASPRPRSPPG